MKKILVLILALLCTLSLVACNNDAENNGDPDTNPPADSQAAGVTVTTALDLTAEWDKNFAQGSLVQGCVVVRKSFAEENPAIVKKFLEEYEASINFAVSNPKEASTMIADAGIFAKAAVAEQALPKCNLCFVTGEEMKTSLSAFLATMPLSSIGGQLPPDSFYYTAPDTQATPDAGTPVRVWTLNGTTGFGMAQLMNQKKNGSTALNYQFTVETQPTNVRDAMINGNADIAAVPTNLAAALNKATGGEVLVIALNTRGVLYVVANTAKVTAPTSLADLNGKKIYCPAQNPTFIAKALFEKAGITVEIDSTTYDEPAELQAAVAQGLVDLAILPEPMVTIAKAAAKTNSAK